jgi:sugar/nucleoside kinase (ribokinase family)
MQNMGTKRNGIIAAGNWIIDHIKVIDTYPAQDSLANIKNESFSNGGSPYNILKNLAKLGASFHLKAIGLVGDDGYGDQIKKDCAEYGIDSTSLQILPGTSTSYTDVMTVESSGRRTFFHQRGANAFLDMNHFDFSSAKEKIFHLGYLLLLNALDKIYEDGTSGASRVLKRACQSGLKTSVDLVSEDSDRFQKVVLPALPYIDYLFLNEFEATRCTGVNLISDKLEYDSLNKAATNILDYGVREWVFIHFPKGVFAKSTSGEIIIQGSVNLPREKVMSAVGAGDALASGILYAIHEEWNITDALRLGVCSAASCLQEFSCSAGIMSHQECLKLGDSYSYRQLEKTLSI